MTHQPPSKKQKRLTTNGSAYHDAVPLDTSYTSIHAREGETRIIGQTKWTAVTQPYLTISDQWSTMTQWSPPDDPEFALDADGDWYDEEVEADVMAEGFPLPGLKKKKAKSMVSKRPHATWMRVHRQEYLDETTRWAGWGDFRTATACPDCIARGIKTPSVPEYRCKECIHPDLTCTTCCLKWHGLLPLHRVQRWTGDRFMDVSLKSMGLKYQLNHGSRRCPNPLPCHASLLVLHTNGIHDVALQYCGCMHALPQHQQLLRRGLYLASQITVKTCSTFELLQHLHTFSLTTKASTYDFYRALECLTDNTGINCPKSQYRALLHMGLQWRHLKMLKWGGRANDESGVGGTKPGDLAILCPSCPRPGINLPDGWEKAPTGMKFLYMAIICMDANFRLKNNLVSNYSQDPGLGTGWAYMVPRLPYEKYVLSQANDEDISTCVGFQALAKANTKNSVGLRYTGAAGVVCGRSEMILPLGVGNLQKGERYSNMDYVFGSALQSFMVPLVLISYDIACQWFVNLFKRVNDRWPEEIKPREGITLRPAIPKLHEPMHQAAGHQVYSLNFIPGVGLTDGKAIERVWASHNPLGGSTRSQGPGSRQDVLDDHFGFWNWLKYVSIRSTLLQRYKAAVGDRNVQVEGHRGLTASLTKPLVKKWEKICRDWEDDVALPRKKPNPYETDGITISEAQVRKELAAEEEERLSKGEAAVHATSTSAFLVIGLELEEVQRRLRRLSKQTSEHTTTQKEGSLMEQRNALRARLRAWEQLAQVYMPGLLQYQADLASRRTSTPATSSASIASTSPANPATSTTPNAASSPLHADIALPPSNHPDDSDLWLPSNIPEALRARICSPALVAMEDKLRTAQCHDSLDSVRHILKIKTRMIYFKNRNVRGQRQGTRSRAVIDRVHERAKVAAEKYRAARRAKLDLVGGGEWEETLRVLENGDIRGYQDANRLRPRAAHRGVQEDDAADQIGTGVEETTMRVDEDGDTGDLSLANQQRSRRDGTGETRRTLSWIWLAARSSDPNDDEKDDILKAEWAKSRARAGRVTEEVMLVKEEMRRVLAFLTWKGLQWKERATQRPGVSKDMTEALHAFAFSQCDVQESLATHFRSLWKNPLQEIESGGGKCLNEDPNADDEDKGGDAHAGPPDDDDDDTPSRAP